MIQSLPLEEEALNAAAARARCWATCLPAPPQSYFSDLLKMTMYTTTAASARPSKF